MLFLKALNFVLGSPTIDLHFFWETVTIYLLFDFFKLYILLHPQTAILITLWNVISEKALSKVVFQDRYYIMSQYWNNSFSDPADVIQSYYFCRKYPAVCLCCPCHCVNTQIHHAGRSQVGHRSSAAPCDRNQRRLLEVRGHQVQEKRGFPGRHRVCQPPGMF